MLNAADDAFLATLGAKLPHGTLRPVDARYLTEPRGRWHGLGAAVALPRTTAEVATIVAACNDARVGLVAWGGGTGLVGGQLQPSGPAPLILSLERMTATRGLYPTEAVLTVEAGAILSDVQSRAAEAGFLFPLSLASEGSARIGGLLACNAGGLNVLRYGNARDLVLGVEAVMADGTVFNGLKRLRKDNTGYDLRHLLIGSEGTLGIITAASLRLFPRPATALTALLVTPSPDTALRLLTLSQNLLPGMISAFELIHRTGFDFLAETMPQITCPLPEVPEWSILIELGLPAGLDGETLMATLYGEADEAGLVTDGVIATSGQQSAQLWQIREMIPEANRHIGAVSSHDISLPLSAIPDFIAKAPAELARIDRFRVNCFGHLGDGNLHYNVFPERGHKASEHEAQRDAVKTAIHDLVDSMGGSVSAEHGIGRLKVKDLETYGDPAKLAAMRAIKTALDPNGILNPGAVLRA
ncbi:FAD-binding oxidoreductase [Paragemmobacter straminiformis]|uniref:FAD-binding oxidoreductase n=1 Tax=Paragemmobacter straminiformis TaxID=2045119 RepID=A0A842IER3_9RHOB|nr:FAD-binding oxidoreductase [Gemmobacter straminiformis]MBC2837394.1 FAD-binding oxidoreductase [Gemmobacter straminiformis]